MPRFVVDANYATAPELRDWFEGGPDHVAVLTDYFAIEAYRRGSAVAVAKQFAILAEFPHQVVIARDTGSLSALPAQAEHGATRVIDPSATCGFPQFCRELRRANGHAVLERAIRKHLDAAEAQLDRMLAGVEQFGAAMNTLAREFHPADLKSIRKPGVPYSAGAIATMLEHIVHLTWLLFEEHPTAVRPLSVEQLPHTFLFRAALCGYLSWKERIADGSTVNVRPETLRNDLVDAFHCATALYFDGLFTNDRRAAHVHQEARALMNELFSRVNAIADPDRS